MQIKIRLTKSRRQIKRIAHLMGKFNLYEESYRFSAFQNFIRDKYIQDSWIECIHAISTAYVDDQIIGLAIHAGGGGYAFYGCEVSCYVKPDYRNQGIGTKLVQKLVNGSNIYLYRTQFPEQFKEKIYERSTDGNI